MNQLIDPQTEQIAHKKVDEAVSGSLYCSLLEWNGIPSFAYPWFLIYILALPKYFINSHKHIITRLQLLVEIDEATSIISKIKEKESMDVMKEHFTHQLIAHMDIWKSRIPSKVEDLTIWKTIMDQRNYLYNLIKKKLETLLTTAPAPAANNPAVGVVLCIHQHLARR